MGNSIVKTRTSLFLIFLILLTVNPSVSFSFSFSHYHTLLSLSHSLTTRVANLRSSRGDYDGAARARAMARKLETFRGLGFWNLAWTMGSDYLRNYAWSDISSMSFNTLSSVFSDVNELLRALNELSQVDSDFERFSWVSRNYKNVLNGSRSMLGKLLSVFRESGAIRELVETLQREVVEGDFLKDCLEVGTDDLKGLVQVFKDIALQYAASSTRRAEL